MHDNFATRQTIGRLFGYTMLGLLVLVGMPGCGPEATQTRNSDSTTNRETTDVATEEVTFLVPAMHCENCVASVARFAEQIQGTKVKSISLETKEVTVETPVGRGPTVRAYLDARKFETADTAQAE